MHRRVRGRLPTAVGAYAAERPIGPINRTSCYGCCSRSWTRGWSSIASTSVAVAFGGGGLLGRLQADRDAVRLARSRSAGDARGPRCLPPADARWRPLVRDRLGPPARARIVLEPPVPWAARPLLETVNFVTIALLPDPIRRQYGFSPVPPPIVRKALVAGGAEYVKRGVLPFLPERLRYSPRPDETSPPRARADRVRARERGVRAVRAGREPWSGSTGTSSPPSPVGNRPAAGPKISASDRDRRGERWCRQRTAVHVVRDRARVGDLCRPRCVHQESGVEGDEVGVGAGDALHRADRCRPVCPFVQGAEPRTPPSSSLRCGSSRSARRSTAWREMRPGSWSRR